MDVFKLLGVVLLSVSAAVLLRTYRPELGLQLSVGVSVLLFFHALADIAAVREALEAMVGQYGLQLEQLALVFKVLGIAYTAQFAVETCRDAGEQAIASRVELLGRLMLVTAALPALMSVLGMVSQLLSGL